jgi:hypothetical protein
MVKDTSPGSFDYALQSGEIISFIEALRSG